VKIKIDDKRIKAKKGETILEAAKRSNIYIPALCSNSDLKEKASCRICVVEINGCLFPACSTKVKKGMEIKTNTEKVRRQRKTNLELLFAQHREECKDCIYDFNCQLLKLAKEYKIDKRRFKNRKKNFPAYKFTPALVFDSSKCIDCRNCVEVCPVNYLELEEKNGFFQIKPKENKRCIFCGQCITHCPVGAFEAEGEFEKVEKALKGNVVVFQFAPSIRTSIGEEFGMQPGEVVTDKLVGAIKRLGVDYVFDVSVGADFTTKEEAEELKEKIERGEKRPMFSSCCPSWVRFVECYYPEFTSNLTTARPPHIILGGLIKTYFAQKEEINPRNIKVVSIMPCVAKKYEITRKELKIGHLKPVDYVLTTRELAYLFYKNKIDLKNIEPEKADNPLGVPSGAGVIYGASGGVMESALRTAFKRASFKRIRGQEGIKKTEITIKGKTFKLAAVNGIKNAKQILEELKKDPTAYSCVEVMACPGGCIGGGGQPVPCDKEIRKKRAEGLYRIDKNKKIKRADENPIVKKVYKEFLNNKKIIKKISHTTFSNKS